MPKTKYYVVWEGREKGIFTDWPTVQKLVSGYPKAKHKSYKTQAEAEAAFASRPKVAPPRQKKTPQNLASSNQSAKKNAHASNATASIDTTFDIHIYCDGGCDPNPGKSGSGVALYQGLKVKQLYYGLYNPNGTNNTAELHALHQSMRLSVDYLAKGLKVQILADSSYALKAMTQWAAGWQKRGWKRKTGELANAQLIQTMYEVYLSLDNQVKDNQVKFQHIKAHAGTEGNELADRLCLLAIRHKMVEFKAYSGTETVNQLLDLS
ncbi:MAG: ribonuclease H family protein [Pseudomonadales bacterium]|nr:ribonuclease H family protein [Pseudomonadales bacterium]